MEAPGSRGRKDALELPAVTCHRATGNRSLATEEPCGTQPPGGTEEADRSSAPSLQLGSAWEVQDAAGRAAKCGRTS
ncbi:hypothetical protein H8959_018754 [Pygathrix nigripes]